MTNPTDPNDHLGINSMLKPHGQVVGLAIQNYSSGIGMHIDTSGGTSALSVGAEVIVSTQPGQTATGVHIVQGGSGTGLKITHSGPGTGLRIVVT